MDNTRERMNKIIMECEKAGVSNDPLDHYEKIKELVKGCGIEEVRFLENYNQTSRNVKEWREAEKNGEQAKEHILMAENAIRGKAWRAYQWAANCAKSALINN